MGACFCLSLSQAVKIIALCSILCGLGVGSVSSWILHRAIQAWKNPTLRTATTLLSQVNTFFSGTTGLYDLEVIYRILTACSATALIGGFVQFIMSFWLLLAVSQMTKSVRYSQKLTSPLPLRWRRNAYNSWGDLSDNLNCSSPTTSTTTSIVNIQDGRTMAKVWVMVQIWVMCAIGGGFLCIMTNELEMNYTLTIFLVITGSDFLLLIYFTWVVFAYSRNGYESDV